MRLSRNPTRRFAWSVVAAMALAACARDKAEEKPAPEGRQAEAPAPESVADAPGSEPGAAAPAARGEDAATSSSLQLAEEFWRSCELVSLDESSAGVLINKKLHSLDLGSAYLVTYRGAKAKLLLEYIDLDAPKADLLFEDHRISLTMDFTELDQRMAQASLAGMPERERIKPVEDSAPASSDGQPKKSAVIYGFTQTVGKGAQKPKPGAPGAPGAARPATGQPAAPAQPGQSGQRAAAPTPTPATRERARTRSNAEPTPLAFQPPQLIQTPAPAPNPNNDPSLPGYVPR